MSSFIHATSYALVAALGLTLAGCANDNGGIGSMFGPTTTASIPEKPKVDPVCVSLVSQIDGLKKEGITGKVEKAAAKKYKMTQADLTKVAQLNKANSEFQMRCAATTTAQLSPAGDAGTQTASVASVQTSKSPAPTTSGGN